MILEGIVTTVSAEGAVNIAPMGPRVDARMEHLLLRPFHTSQTYRNLKVHPEGVFHVTDDVLLLARAALAQVAPPPQLSPAARIQGFVLTDACRYYEFRIRSIDDTEERSRMEAEVVHVGRRRDFFGFNRAKHAVVEAAILATRIHLLAHEDIDNEYRKLAILVDKTGGDQEKAAFALLHAHVKQCAESPRESRGHD